MGSESSAKNITNAGPICLYKPKSLGFSKKSLSGYPQSVNEIVFGTPGFVELIFGFSFTTKVLYMSFDRFLLAVESLDLSQDDESII
jgi:hypothetical protein